MADFGHLMNTMDQAKGVQKKSTKPKRNGSDSQDSPNKSASIRVTSTSTMALPGMEPAPVKKNKTGKKKKTGSNPTSPKISPTNTATKKSGTIPKQKKIEGDGTIKKKKKEGGDGTTKKKKKKKPENGTSDLNKKSSTNKSGGDPAVAVPTKVANRLGGTHLDKAKEVKSSDKLASMFVEKKDDGVKRSKIWQALNPTSLYAEEEKNDDERNIVQMRGGAGIGLLDMEDHQADRDEFGNIIHDEEEEEEDDDGMGFEEDESDNVLADFDDETMKELLEKRAKREQEQEEKRKLMRRKSLVKQQKRQAELEKELAQIAKKKAAELKKEEMSEAEIKAAQENAARLQFGFEFS